MVPWVGPDLLTLSAPRPCTPTEEEEETQQSKQFVQTDPVCEWELRVNDLSSVVSAFLSYDQSIRYLHRALGSTLPPPTAQHPWMDSHSFRRQQGPQCQGTAGGHSQGWGRGRPGTRFVKKPGRRAHLGSCRARWPVISSPDKRGA